ncbi:MAG: hypothetical protein VB084_07345 [Syntrophomonadaceae bacterium]|nr:hypothetical protein [Syntrophomonadaceae bacterium]
MPYRKFKINLILPAQIGEVRLQFDEEGRMVPQSHQGQESGFYPLQLNPATLVSGEVV